MFGRTHRGWRQWLCLTVFEVRQQGREPLTWLYALIFGLLSFGFTSGGAIELVGNRGRVPVASAWSLWLAFGGLTAFGQVITTMVAVTAVLRDHATRMADVVASTGVSARTWLAAQLAAAGVVLGLVYLAMPLGAALGLAIAVLRGAEPAATVWAALPRLSAAFVVLTVPTMLVVGTLVGVGAALTRRTMAALFVSLMLVGCWHLALTLVAQPSTAWLGALLDPFGNAPVLAVTRDWTERARSLRELPYNRLLLMNRCLWLAVGATGLALGVWRVRWPTGQTDATPNTACEAPTQGMVRDALSRRDSVRGTRWAAPRTIAVFTARWVARDGGWRAVAALAAANALVNAALQQTGGAPESLPTYLNRVAEHARVFCILLATVYAGEIVWRDRDVRVSEVVDVLPVSSAAMALSRLAGVLWQQARLVLVIATGALAIGAWRGHVVDLPAVWMWVAWSVFHLWAPFAQWTALSLAVHVCVRHKVGAHLLLITGWVVAFALNQAGAAQAWWYRYAEPAALFDGNDVAWSAMLTRGGYWMGVAAVLTVLAARWWPRGSMWASSARLQRRRSPPPR